MGFYFGRECGNIYLANRKSFTVRPTVIYIPWRQLRDAWELSKYLNLNQFQITINNKDLVPPSAHKWTDAHLSSHSYNFAITLMSSPIFFSEMQYYSKEARDELRPLIAAYKPAYKRERNAMYQGYVSPIGQHPDNRSWSGLQNHNPSNGQGYITVFRELHNPNPKHTLSLNHFRSGDQLELENIQSGQSRTVTLGEGATANFEIPEAPGFLFLKYKTAPKP